MTPAPALCALLLALCTQLVLERGRDMVLLVGQESLLPLIAPLRTAPLLACGRPLDPIGYHVRDHR